MKDTTVAISIKTEGSENYLQVQAKKSYSEPLKGTPCLFGGSSLMPVQGRKVLIAPCSEMSQRTKARNLYAKRIKLLMSSGLIAGITPTSERKRSNQQTLDFALFSPDGIDCEEEQGLG
jgi:hypothetical protein